MAKLKILMGVLVFIFALQLVLAGRCLTTKLGSVLTNPQVQASSAAINTCADAQRNLGDKRAAAALHQQPAWFRWNDARRAARSTRPHAALQKPVPLTLITKAEVCSRQSVAAAISTNHFPSILAKRLRKEGGTGKDWKVCCLWNCKAGVPQCSMKRLMGMLILHGWFSHWASSHSNGIFE